MSALRSKKGSLTMSTPGQHSREGNRCPGVYLRNMAESMNQKGMTIVKGSHTPIAAPVIDPGRDGKMVFPFSLSRLPQTISYLITRVSMQYRELLHEWVWYFHKP